MSSIYVKGNAFKGIGVLTEPNSYGTNITPENMQHGKTAVSKGKIVIGTGKCFEFVQYGSKVVREIIDTDGVTRYGVPFEIEAGANIVFLASSDEGDFIIQTEYLVNMIEGATAKIGKNISDGGDVYAHYTNGLLTIYLSNEPKEETTLRLFIGKDNEL